MEKLREYGKRTLIRCILPRGENWKVAQFDLTKALADQFGGFTRYEATGAWKDSLGVVIERADVWEVSFQPNPARERDAIAYFEKAGRATGQTWLHVERHEFDAEHVKLR